MIVVNNLDHCPKIQPNNVVKVSFGTFLSGSGSTDDPMIFTSGSSESCGVARSGRLYYRYFSLSSLPPLDLAPCTRNFRFLHIWHVLKSEISPHDRFFSTYIYRSYRWKISGMIVLSSSIQYTVRNTFFLCLYCVMSHFVLYLCWIQIVFVSSPSPLTLCTLYLCPSNTLYLVPPTSCTSAPLAHCTLYLQHCVPLLL